MSFSITSHLLVKWLLVVLITSFANTTSTLNANSILIKQLVGHTVGNAQIKLAQSDVDGSVYVAGEFQGTIRTDSEIPPLTSEKPAWFLGKVASDGRWLWCRDITTSTTNCLQLTLTSLAVQNGVAYAGGYRIAKNDHEEVFINYSGLILKVNALNGNVLWDRYLNGGYGMPKEPGEGITNKIRYIHRSKVLTLSIDRNNQLLVGGAYQRSLVFPSSPLNPVTLGLTLPPTAGQSLRVGKLTDNWDMYLTKLRDSNGWAMWALSGGSSLDNDHDAITGIAVDSANQIYVTGCVTGNDDKSNYENFAKFLNSDKTRFDIYNFKKKRFHTGKEAEIDRRGIFWARIRVDPDSTGETAKWEFIRLNDQIPDSTLMKDGDPAGVWSTGIALVNGKLYVSGYSTGFGGVSTNGPSLESQEALRIANDPTYGMAVGNDPTKLKLKSGFVIRLKQSGEFEAATVFRSSRARQEAVTRLDAAGSRIYVAGMMGNDMDIVDKPGQLSPGTLPAKNVTSTGPNFFLARLDGDLSASWVRTTSRPNEEAPPVNLAATAVACDAERGRVWLGGWFSDNSRPARKLVLGNADVITRLPATAGSKQSFLTALSDDSDGEFLESVSLSVASDFGTVLINGLPVSDSEGGTYFKGIEISAMVPFAVYHRTDGTQTNEIFGLNSAAEFEEERKSSTRHLCKGFHVEDEKTVGYQNRFSFPLLKDTRIVFDWSTEHAVIVQNDLQGLEVQNSNLGNPAPAVGKHWIVQGQRTDAFVDGFVNDLDSSRIGTRYIPQSVVLTGSARPAGSNSDAVTNFLAEDAILPRVQVGQFGVTGPATITYSWSKQYRVQVSTSIERASGLPYFQTNPTGFDPLDGGTGEYWFNAGSYLQIGSRATGNLRTLTGWRNGDGEFPSLEGGLNHIRLTHPTDGPDRYFLTVANLGRPTRVMWNYDNQVFRQDVPIGGALDLAAVSVEAEAESGVKLQTNVPPGTKTIVDAPPGSTVEEMAEWDDVRNRLYPVRPGITQYEWETDQEDNPVVVQVVSGFPGDRIPDADSGFFLDPGGPGRDAYRYRHLTRTPGVSLDSDPTDARHFIGLKFTESDGVASEGLFTASRPGRSVLLFSEAPSGNVAAVGNRAQEVLQIRVVESRNWDQEFDTAAATNLPTGSWNLPWRQRLLSEPVSSGLVFTNPLALNPLPVGVLSETVVIPGDFDGDGVRDLLLLGLGQEVRLQRGGHFGEPPQILSSTVGSRLDSAGVAGDLDGDGDLDLVRATSSGKAYVYLNRGGPEPFTGVEPEEFTVGNPVAMQLIELSHPGRLDLLVASGGNVLRFEGRDPARSGPMFAAERSENLAEKIGVTGSVTSMTAGDQDGDGTTDLVVGEADGTIHLIHGLPGKDLFKTEVQRVEAGGRIASLAIGNVIGTNVNEILALVGQEQGEIKVYEPKGSALDFKTSTNGVTSRSLALLPPDASGHSPVVFGGAAGITQWSPASGVEFLLYPAGAVRGLGALGTGDLDGDGLPDLYLVEKVTPEVYLFPSGGSGLLAKGPVRTAVGSALQSPFDRSLQGQAYVIPGVKGNAPYNARLHPAGGVAGPIIPVNERFDTNRFDELVVAWYEVREGIEWPYQPVRYQPQWPDRPGGVGSGAGTLQRIVIASRLGSEGLTWGGRQQGSLDPELWEEVAVYNQPDPSLPGYNPNEEHARIYPSLLSAPGNPTPAAFALRDDLNVSKQLLQLRRENLGAADYTSDPFVLVEYRNRATGTYGMSVYAVERQDPDAEDSRLLDLPGAVSARYIFEYRMNAGERVTAPYPMNLVLGLLPCVNTVPEPFGVESSPNGTVYRDGPGQRTYFVDHKGEGWAVSGNGALLAHFFYRLEPDFWYPTSLLDPVRTTGDCVPWLPTRNPSLEDTIPNRSSIRGPVTGAFANWKEDANYPARIQFLTTWPTSVPTLKAGETLTFAGGEYKADHPEAPGLPGVVGWAAGQVVFDSLNPQMSTDATAASDFTAWIISPLEERLVSLPRAKLPGRFEPSEGHVTVVGTEYRFKELPPSLQKRLFYDPFRKLNANSEPGVLGLRGYLNDRTLGDSQLTAAPPPVYLLEPNVLTGYEKEVLLGISKDPVTDIENSPYTSLKDIGTWTSAVIQLFELSRNPQQIELNGVISKDYLTGVQGEVKYDANGKLIPDSNGQPSRYVNRPEPLHSLGPGLALIPSPRFLEPHQDLPSASYVTLAENNDESLGSAPVALHIVQVVRTNLYRGAIKTIASDNVFDEKLTLRHTADFGGNVDQLRFSWWNREEDGRWKVYSPLPPDPLWSAYGKTNGLLSLNQIDLQGANPLLLADNLFFVHYQHNDSPAESIASWSDWAGAANSTPRTNSLGQPGFRPQLATGWVKRVFNRLTPYEARFNDFRNNPSPATYASLIQQAGPPPRGAVALNPDKNVIENAGLLEIYQTVIDRAKALSINSTQPTTTAGISAALMLGTTRISQLYKLLGDEAVSDAFDPTIGFGTSSTEYGKLAPTIFAFQNQVGSLLEEELALLRGLDEDRAWPVHNRLSWNFTRAEGEAAYAMNYGIRDVNNDGFINERDGQIQFPQGHGDAWGHYLSAIRQFYDLIGNRNFKWQTRAEWFNQSDVVIPVDYLDERKFAEIAGARAAAGAEIVSLSLRSHYTEDPWGQWQGYRDGDSSRAWGTMEWARRAGQATLLDWVMANALLPSRDTNHPALSTVPETASGIQKLDRSTVPEIARISAALGSIQSTYDTANGRLNPLGLDPDVVPFDLDPTFVDVGSTAQIGRPAVQGLTHFEQIYERAFSAVDNATAAFDYATEQQHQLRRVADDVESNRKQAIAQDTEFRNRLIEIFGTPYRGTIGSGKPYPSGYEGPDLSLWMYADVREVSKDTVPAPSSSYSIQVTSFKADLVSLNDKFKNLKVEGHPRDFFGSAVTNWDANLVSWTSVQLTDNSVLDLQMPATARGYTFQAPSTWGERAAPGRLQSLVSDMVQIEADLSYAVGNYDYLLNDIKRSMSLISAKVDLANSSVGIGDDQRELIKDFNNKIEDLEHKADLLATSAEVALTIGDAFAEGLPTVVGVDNDVTSIPRSILKIAGVGAYTVLQGTAAAARWFSLEEEFNKEESATEAELRIERLGFSYEIEEQLKEIHQMMVNEGTTRIAVFRIREQLRQKADEFRATLEEGVRLIEERQVLNQQLAAATQENRYADFLLRNSRNEALQKYRAAFDLASRYTFLATKAFDYETNFDPNDRLSPRPLLSQIVRERTLGQLLDGKPQHRGGLAGVLAGLYENFRVIEGQLGFNNPQLEFNRFSLRQEKLGIRRVPDPESLDPETRMEGESEDDWKNRVMEEYKFTDLEKWAEAFKSHNSVWKTSLRTYLKTNLWEVPEFRRFCRPFAARGSAEPGLVIPFSTEVKAGKNFFGNDLSPGDSAYDPSNFSTKIRSVRVNFVDYDPSELALTPRVYLVPAGLDGMYVPNQSDFKPVYWNVSDQRIPVPVQTGPSDLTRPNWLAAIDSLGGPLGEIRRFSSFRAYLEDADPDVMTRDTRLVGRSVWNTQWLLIVPGRALLADPEQGLEKFMESVSDITLAFETYGNSGN